ncbi:hypothetical protein [Sphingomonas sp. LaA6.9]|uniref:hypothetical protein n=1 Tax=Sphingomonas sp. LaA6.9 TaxID=2919914 RepID=UPI001F4F7DEC|nr:hypothetical protein [Sphingomonas sp. LaA6.9]MCJ8157416.1 hypothetical protein [Sphingomonas sp. LaA6.9]
MRTRPETTSAAAPTPADMDDGLADLLAFDPVPMARRSARGWTVARQRAFIAALAHYGVVSDAARAVGMSVRSAYALRLRPGAESFDAAWMCAQEEAMRDRKGEVLDRALNGDPVSPLIGGKPARVPRDLSLGKQLRVFTALGREQVGRDARAQRPRRTGNGTATAPPIVRRSTRPTAKPLRRPTNSARRQSNGWTTLCKDAARHAAPACGFGCYRSPGMLCRGSTCRPR